MAAMATESAVLQRLLRPCVLGARYAPHKLLPAPLRCTDQLGLMSNGLFRTLLRSPVHGMNRRTLQFRSFTSFERSQVHYPNARIHSRSAWSRPLVNFASGKDSHGSRKVLLGAAASAVSFTQFDDDDDSNKTREERMLELSRDELVQTVPESPLGKVVYYLVNWLIEPIWTFCRFLHLAALFGPLILAMPIVALGPVKKETGDRRGALLWYQYLRWTMEMAGSSFIKLGQWAASRSDIFPQSMCDELGKLHSNGTPHHMRHTRREIRRAFGREIPQVFEEFEEKPLGVGAMGQVYRARFRTDIEMDGIDPGHLVVVKVLHPGIEKTVSRDLRIMMLIANIINALPTMEWLSLPGEVETFGVMMQTQLDLRIEAENLRIFQHNFDHMAQAAFPTPYPTGSSRNVLIEELIEGVSMEKVLKFHKQDSLDREIASVGLDSFLKMLLIDNFIHSDLHAGNIILRLHKSKLGTPEAEQEMHESTTKLNGAKDQESWDKVWSEYERGTYKPQLCFIDAGLVTELNPKNQRNFVDLFKAIATFDGYKAGELMVERSRTPETAVDSEVFALRTQKLVDQVKKRTFALGSVNIGDLLGNMMEMVRRHHVRMESDFINVVLSILLLEGIGRQLDPNLDIFKSALPILRQVSSSSFKGSNVSKAMGNVTSDDAVQMVKVWLALEVRQFITASIQDIHNTVKYDLLSPNK